LAESGDSASDLLVIFGITGDLARKMTFQALYRLERRELLQCPVLGVASDDIAKEELVNRARKAIADAWNLRAELEEVRIKRHQPKDLRRAKINSGHLTGGTEWGPDPQSDDLLPIDGARDADRIEACQCPTCST